MSSPPSAARIAYSGTLRFPARVALFPLVPVCRAAALMLLFTPGLLAGVMALRQVRKACSYPVKSAARHFHL